MMIVNGVGKKYYLCQGTPRKRSPRRDCGSWAQYKAEDGKLYCKQHLPLGMKAEFFTQDEKKKTK
jgi:hypothetical protein